MQKMTLAIGALVLLLGACGKEVGRVPFTAEGQGEATMTLAAGEVAFWTDLDVDYEGGLGLGYTVQLVQNGNVVATASCDPLGQLNVKTSWVETNFNGKASKRGNGKMSCGVSVPQGGPTVVKVQFTVKGGGKMALRKADLAVRQ